MVVEEKTFEVLARNLIPHKFVYYAPKSLREAIELFSEKQGSKVIAGGQSLLTIMKLRLVRPSALVDISGLMDELSYVQDRGKYLAVGGLVTHDEAERNDTIRENFPILHDSISKIADQQIRNLGTVGGAVCAGDPAGDLPVALRTIKADFVLQGRNGNRILPSEDFLVGAYKTAANADEILTEIRLPYLPPRSGSASLRHSLRENDFAIMIVGTVLALDGGGICSEARIGIAPAGPIPSRATAAEKCLIGKKLDDEVIYAAGEKAVEGANPREDINGSRDYKLHLIKVLTKRSLKLALSRIKQD